MHAYIRMYIHAYMYTYISVLSWPYQMSFHCIHSLNVTDPEWTISLLHLSTTNTGRTRLISYS